MENQLIIKCTCIVCGSLFSSEISLSEIVIQNTQFEVYGFLYAHCKCGWSNHLRVGDEVEHMDYKDLDGNLVNGLEMES